MQRCQPGKLVSAIGIKQLHLLERVIVNNSMKCET